MTPRKKVRYQTLFKEMSAPPPMPGRKDDSGKPRYHLIPPFAELEVVNVLTYGGNRYGDNNWENILAAPGGVHRYLSGVLRHIAAYRRGSPHDPDSSYHHLAHAICGLLFILEGDMLGWDREEPPE